MFILLKTTYTLALGSSNPISLQRQVADQTNENKRFYGYPDIQTTPEEIRPTKEKFFCQTSGIKIVQQLFIHLAMGVFPIDLNLSSHSHILFL